MKCKVLKFKKYNFLKIDNSDRVATPKMKLSSRTFQGFSRVFPGLKFKSFTNKKGSYLTSFDYK